MGFVLLLGGARSGKSDLACRLAAESGREVTVIATATAGDPEMAARIDHHRGSRPAHWQTIVRGTGVFGSFEDKTFPAAPGATAKAPRLLITGGAVFGSVIVKN